MSIGLDILQEGFTARLDVYGVPMVHVASGLKFTAIIEPMVGIDPRLELASDLREMAIIHALQSAVPAIMTAADAPIEHQLTNAGSTWKTVKRDNNPGDFTIKFWAVKVTTQDS